MMISRSQSIALFFLCTSIFFSAYRSKTPGSNYQLSSPDKTYVLPPVLNEISGITFLNKNEVACVQDESGVVYVFDLTEGKVTHEYKTGLIGDYEGIALVGTTIYMLRSDGVLTEYPDFTSPNLKIKEYILNLPSPNNEGLCYDMQHHRLLIAAKVKPGKDKAEKDIRHIYSFDLKSKIPTNYPILKLDLKELEKAAVKNNIPIPTKTNKNKGTVLKDFNFRPSEIAVHPINRFIYVLAANDKLLLVMDDKGKVQNIMALDPHLFNKAEGLAFLPDGTMLISNEAQQGNPTLLTFKYN